MVVVDTSAWIEWLIGSATARRIEPHLPPPAEWVVLTCDAHFKGLPAVTLVDKGGS